MGLFSIGCGEEQHEHVFTNYVSNHDATFTADGTKTAKCDKCDVTDTIADIGSKLNPSLSEVSRERIELALHINADGSEEYFTPLDKIKMAYTTAFTKSFTLDSDAKTVLDKVFAGGNEAELAIFSVHGGTKVGDDLNRYFRNQPKTAVLSKQDFISGDIMLTEENGKVNVYVFYRDKLIDYSPEGKIDFTKDCFDEVAGKLSTYSRFIGLRPSNVIKGIISYEKNAKFNENDENLTDEQIAVVKTAYQYYLRGQRVQYNDNANSKPFGPNGLMREQIQALSPEASTLNEYKYTNCAMYCYDVYYHALGLRFQDEYGNDLSTTSIVADACSLDYLTNKSFTALYLSQSQMKKTSVVEIKEKVFSTLKPGDELVIRRTDGSGHALLYVGNGYILHSGGSSYDILNDKETYEASIRLETIDDMFDAVYSPRQFIPSMVSFTIARPINLLKESIPVNSVNRVNDLEGVMTEKLPSVSIGQTVNVGDEITFTYNIRNLNKQAKTITIKDKAPFNTTYVSSTGNPEYESGDLTWELVVGADEMKTVSFTVKVTAGSDEVTSTGSNKIISNDGKVNGVLHGCYGIVIANTLTESQQSTLLSAIGTVKGKLKSSSDGVVTANAIYKQAFSVDNALGVDSVKDYLPLVNRFEVDDTKKGYIARGNKGSTVQFEKSDVYGVSKAIDVENQKSVLVCNKKNNCSIVVLDSDGNIVDKADFTSSYNSKKYACVENAKTLYLNYKTDKAEDYALLIYDDANEKTSSDKAIFVREDGENADDFNRFVLNNDGKASLTVAPSLYGGRIVATTNYDEVKDVMPRFTETRMRMFFEDYLVVGDIFYEYTWQEGYDVKTTWQDSFVKTATPRLYMYIGNGKMISLSGDDIYTEYNATKTVLDCYFSSQVYAVLRPSMQNGI